MDWFPGTSTRTELAPGRTGQPAERGGNHPLPRPSQVSQAGTTREPAAPKCSAWKQTVQPPCRGMAGRNAGIPGVGDTAQTVLSGFHHPT